MTPAGEYEPVHGVAEFTADTDPNLELRVVAIEKGFWPVYEEYRAELLVVRDRQAMLIAELMKRYQAGTMTDDYADGLISDNFDIERDLMNIQEKFVRQFGKVLPMLKVARFYQLENKIDAEVDAQLALFVPLVEAL